MRRRFAAPGARAGRRPLRRAKAGTALLAALAGCVTVGDRDTSRPRPIEVDTGCVETGETYPAFEVSFRLAGLEGNPFAAEVWAVVERPGGRPVRVPAFHDGGDVWRARYTPDRRGPHRVKVTLGPAGGDAPAKAAFLSPSELDVEGDPAPGFVRRSRGRVQQFVFDNGDAYFPLGYNVAWTRAGDPAIFEEYHEKMRAAGLNWSRHWMAGFAALNLDWHGDVRASCEGRLDLEIARKWDRIVRSAERNGIRFQMVLQHHGQYSTSVNSNWQHCPWNAAKGGFLESADEYFTNARAKELTRLKYRYVVARWGHSTAVMAWELFNEFQLTDGYIAGDRPAVVRWHEEMAAHIRSLDPYRHLVTTSSVGADHPVWRAMDFHQPHVYGEDVIGKVSGFERPVSRFGKPVFYGEAGDGRFDAEDRKDGRYNRSLLWAGLMSGGAGAAQHWFWDRIGNIGGDFHAAARFVRAGGIGERMFAPAKASADCDARIPVVIVPRGGFSAGTMVVDLTADGLRRAQSSRAPVEGLAEMPPYLHGDEFKRRQGMAGVLFFCIDAAETTTLEIAVDIVGMAGAEITIHVDARPIARRTWPGAEADYDPNETVVVKDIPPGEHTITVESTGTDWFHVKSYTFSSYAKAALAALGRASRDEACVWVYNRLGVHADEPGPVEGTVTLEGLRRGEYEIEWWDTARGEPVSNGTAGTGAKGKLTFPTPPVARDAAAIVRPVRR